MIIRIHGAGKSFKGLAAYLTHDPKAQTEERVSWTHTLNLSHDLPNSAVDEMLWTARSAELLKQEAGIPGGGRVTENTLKHVSLNWAPQEKPSRDDMINAAEGFLKHMKWEDHQALLVAHSDKEYAHVHLMINTVHPDTGLHLDDNFEFRRAQKWGLGYERQNGEILCAQRVANVTDREEAPTRPAWTAFKTEQKEYEQAEKKLADQSAEHADDKENAKVTNLDDWKRLKEFQRQERTEFFSEGKVEFMTLRRVITREVREEFREQWADYYRAVKSGEDKAVLAPAKEALVAEQKEELADRRDIGCKALRTARDEQYRELLDYQQDTRGRFRARQDCGLDNTIFFQHLDEGSFRDRWPGLREPISADSIIRQMKEERGEPANDRIEEKSERPIQVYSRVPNDDGPSLASEGAKALDIASNVGLSLIFFFDGISDGAPGASSNHRQRPAPQPSRDPFEGVLEDAAKKQQAEKEEAAREWRRKQQSYGE